ncbi:hypothetical protein [Sphaerisporangium sp. TRM90804]|uniref:hypothetical protein n=1 Tax=Sphaerisporangium sp. TRM90804 TaxID=3031113 RepID=UPI00244B2C72|nr:hypothetical protein [Sphaerisporangium sp. TRM90804]MDH2429307.1 hypothetical protein [Sphaerisporangium sp. TRM90804]
MMISRRERLRLNPFGTVAASAAVVLGGIAAVLGDDISQGMTNSLRASAEIMAHLWGASLAAGGLLKLYGLYAGRSTMEIPGLWMMAGGYGFYAITVVGGLGLGGLAAGILSTALAVGSVIKVQIIMRHARNAVRLHDAEGE